LDKAKFDEICELNQEAKELHEKIKADIIDYDKLDLLGITCYICQ
jgi:hypothetical protein